MTTLPHTIMWKLFHYEPTELTNTPRESVDSVAFKAMQMHAEEIEVARRFWACPFQTLSGGSRRIESPLQNSFSGN